MIPDSVNQIKLIIWDLGDSFINKFCSEKESSLVKDNIDFAKIIKDLDFRGIINSIICKSASDGIREILKKKDLWDFFILPQFNVGSKSESIKRIASGLGVSLCSIAFISDNINELEEVKNSFHEIRVFSFELVTSLLNMPEFSVIDSKTNSWQRHMYIEEFNRREFLESCGLDKDEFLKKINLEMSVIENNYTSSKEQQIIDLLNQANNWHLTGHRNWTSEILNQFRQDLNYILLSFFLKDIFGSYGCVGVTLMKIDKKNNTAYVQELVMSCRAASKTVDIAIIRELAQKSLSLGLRHIIFRLFMTNRNIPLQRFLLSICNNNILNLADGFIAEIPDASIFLQSKYRCFINKITFDNYNSKNKILKAKKGFSLKNIGDKYYLSPDADTYGSSSKMFILNNSGKFIWELLQEYQSEENIILAVARHFDLKREDICDEVHEFLLMTQKENLIDC